MIGLKQTTVYIKTKTIMIFNTKISLDLSTSLTTYNSNLRKRIKGSLLWHTLFS